jgi:BlaI family transcriptional regulator, penicillinase repressor
MKSFPRISGAEWEVMKAVWQGAPCSADEIIARLANSDPSWHPKTTRTFLNRLVKKGALAFDKEGRAYLYKPLVTERECIDAASESFLDRVFGGSLKPMLAHFVEQKKLSEKEIRELRDILNKSGK